MKTGGQRKKWVKSSSTSMSSTISTVVIQNIVDRLQMQRYRDSTRNTYYRVWRLFNEFFIRLDDKPQHWEDRMVLFTGFLISNNLKSTSIRSYLSAIKGVLAENLITMNEDRFLPNSLTRACKIKNDTLVTRIPIRRDLVNLLLTEADKHLHKSMIVAAYYGMLRIGELTLSPNVILACNVHMGLNKNKVLFVLLTSKTHGKGSKPQRVKIAQKPVHYQDNSLPVTPVRTSKAKAIQQDPFKILSDFVDRHPPSNSDAEQFFVFSDNTPVKPEHMRHNLKMLTNLNLQAELYTVHMMRVSRASDLMDCGLFVETIKKLGRWKLIKYSICSCRKRSSHQ